MDANKISLLTIFEKKMRLEVPLFQRQYVWSQEQQWEPLWEDICRKFTECLEGRADAPVHFLGAMVLDQKRTPTGFVEKRQIIDGQQRLTTLQLFISAFSDFCRKNGSIELADECASYTRNRGKMDDEGDQFKVWPTQLDRAQFKDVILAGSREALERQHPIVKKKWARKPESRPKMIECYIFFYDQLSDFFFGDDAICGEEDLDARMMKCFQALKNALQVVTIDLDSGDDPQVIFETLNARGEPLLPADLLKNYIFLRAARAATHPEDQPEVLYSQFWKPFDDEFWRKEVKQGRLNRPRSDLFMQHFLASRIGEDIPIKHLFVEYKNWVDRKRPFVSIREELATLSKQGANFRRIVEPQELDFAYRLAVFLENFDIRTAYPLLLALLEADITEQEWLEFSITLESYLLRRAVCGLSTKNYNRIFLQLTRGLRRDGISAENLKNQLAIQSGDSAEWPSDGTFKRAWIEKPAYELGNAKLVHIFSKLCETYITTLTEPLRFMQQPTIEHVMPQKWVANWPLPDGSKGMEDAELWLAKDTDPCAKATSQRKQAVQTFGNLTILTQALNSTQSNSAWADKQILMLQHSLLPINLDFHDVDVWDESAIALRGEKLFERALKIWPRG